MDVANMLNLVREVVIFYFSILVTISGVYVSVVMFRRLVKF